MKQKRRGIKAKMTIAFILMGVLLSFCVGIAVFSVSYRQVSAHYSQRAVNSARAVAGNFSGDNITFYLNHGKNEEYFIQYEELKELKTAFGLTYLYIVTKGVHDDTAVYVFDIFTEGDDPALIGDLGEPLSDVDAAAFASAEQTFRTGQIENNTFISLTAYGWLASAFMPVYDSDGSITAILGVDISMNTIMGEIIFRSLQIIFILIVAIGVFLLVLRYITGTLILKPITNLSNHMDSFDYEAGVLEAIKFRKSGDEFQTIAESFNQMMSDIRHYIDNLAQATADRERIATELKIAKEIQTSMLPHKFPAFPERSEFDIYATLNPDREVGGDFFDFFLVRGPDDDRVSDDTHHNTLAVVVADISGRGIPAALFMVITKTLIKNAVLDGKTPNEVFETVNNMLSENNETGMSVTAFMGYLDIPSRRFTYVNAGHKPPVIKQGDVSNNMDINPGHKMAVQKDLVFEQEEITLTPGDKMVLYTTDVTMLTLEIKDEVRRMFEITLPAKVENLDKVQSFIEESAFTAKMDKKSSNNLIIAVEEIFVNIANYAYRPAEGEVDVSLTVSDESISIEFKDAGAQYNPLEKADPDVTLTVEEREIGGLGIFMVKKLMDSVSYRYEDGKNILTIRKTF